MLLDAVVHTSMPSLYETSLHDVTQHNQNQANQSPPPNSQRHLSKKANSLPRKVDNLPRKAKSRLYKSEMCKAFVDMGNCKYGGKCQYAHGEGELRFVQKNKNYKTVQCKAFWTTGYCKYGNRCCFVHQSAFLGGSAFAMTPSPQCLSRARAESQPLMFTPTIVEEPEDEPVEEYRTEAFRSKKKITSSSGLDLNSIADCLVDEDDDSIPELKDAFNMKLSYEMSQNPVHSFAEACSKLEQRLGRELSQEEVNKTKNKPEVACQPCEFNALGRKHQSMPNVLSPAPSRKISRLNVFQQLSEQDHVTSLFIRQGQAA
jgi:hypothetical protein